MSGRLTGEVLSHTGLLRSAGVPFRAGIALVVVAERCYDANRCGSVSLGHVAEGLWSSQRTASRMLALLVSVGLLTVAQRGGGRGRAGQATVYRLADIRAWLAERGHLPVASQSAPPAAEAVDDVEAGPAPGPLDAPMGDPGGESIRPGGDRIEPPAGSTRHDDGDRITHPPVVAGESTRHPSGDPIAADGGSIGDPVAISGRLTRHPGGDIPVEEPGKALGETPEVATGPREIDLEPAPTPAPARRSKPGDGRVPEGSLCRRPGCRAPRPCRPCGDARAARAAAQERDRLAAALAARRALEERDRRLAVADRAATAACPHGCAAPCVHRGHAWAMAHIRLVTPPGRPLRGRPRFTPAAGGGRHRAPGRAPDRAAAATPAAPPFDPYATQPIDPRRIAS